MDEYAKELLRQNLETSQESLSILKKMHRARVVSGVFKAIKWIVIIGLSLGSYYYIEPYLNAMLDALNSISSGMGEVRKVGEAVSPSNLTPGLMEKLKNLLPK